MSSLMSEYTKILTRKFIIEGDHMKEYYTLNHFVYLSKELRTSKCINLLSYSFLFGIPNTFMVWS